MPLNGDPRPEDLGILKTLYREPGRMWALLELGTAAGMKVNELTSRLTRLKQMGWVEYELRQARTIRLSEDGRETLKLALSLDPGAGP